MQKLKFTDNFVAQIKPKMSVLNLDTYLQLDIFDFLPSYDYYAVSETCKEFNQTIKKFKKNFETPPVEDQVKSMTYFTWCKSHPNFAEESCLYPYNAILQGDLNMLRYLCQQRYPLTNNCWFAAACVEDIHIMKFLLRKFVPFHPMAFEYLVIADNQPCLKFILDIDNNFSNYQFKNLIDMCLKKDKVKNLKVLTDKFNTLPSKALYNAVRYGALNCVKFIIKWVMFHAGWDFDHRKFWGFNKCSSLLINIAAEYNYFDIIKYLRTLEYSWNTLTLYTALQNKEIFTYCYKAGCPCDETTLEQARILYPDLNLPIYASEA